MQGRCIATAPRQRDRHHDKTQRQQNPPRRCIIQPMIPLSILDLAPITEGSDAATALRNTLDLAQHAEAWGYHR